MLNTVISGGKKSLLLVTVNTFTKYPKETLLGCIPKDVERDTGTQRETETRRDRGQQRREREQIQNYSYCCFFFRE